MRQMSLLTRNATGVIQAESMKWNAQSIGSNTFKKANTLRKTSDPSHGESTQPVNVHSMKDNTFAIEANTSPTDANTSPKEANTSIDVKTSSQTIDQSTNNQNADTKRRDPLFSISFMVTNSLIDQIETRAKRFQPFRNRSKFIDISSSDPLSDVDSSESETEKSSDDTKKATKGNDPNKLRILRLESRILIDLVRSVSSFAMCRKCFLFYPFVLIESQTHLRKYFCHCDNSR